jgi:hypothetical protein
MRGGAIPILAWGVLLSVLTIGNAIWQGKWLPAGQFALAAVIIFAFGAFVIALSGRRALRKGPPATPTDPEVVPEASAAAAGAGLSLALLLFGIVFGGAVIYLGAGFLLLSLGRVVIELRAQRVSARAARQEPRE